jgi:trigger factor
LTFSAFLSFGGANAMTDETRTEAQEPHTPAAVEEHPTVPLTEPIAPIAEAEEESEGEEAKSKKIQQTVEMKDIGPCKKHIKVTVDRADIDRLLNDKFSELVSDAPVAGFRPGKAPRRIVERRFKREVTNQVRGEVLMQSLEQLAEENDIAPLTAPNLDPTRIEIPDQGPLIYEFDVEVRPEFELPNYRGLKLRRPVRTFTDEDVIKEEHRFLGRYGSLVPKDGPVDIDDYVVVDMATRAGDRELTSHKEITIRVDPQLALKDAVARDFGARLKGARAGEQRTVELTLSDSVAEKAMRGQVVQATLDIKDVKSLRLPELTHDFLHHFGVHTEEQLRERVRVTLERRLEMTQRQAARQQVLEQFAAAATWELPRDLLQRQARKAFNRRVMEMQSAGMSDDDIRARVRLLEQDVLRTTELALKEHFLLQKIAEVENLEINEDDINDEIERIAAQNDESPRRVRARLEKEDLLEALATEIVESKALDLILQSAEYEDVPFKDEAGAVGTVEEQAVPGEMKDPTEAPLEPETPPAESTEEKPSESQSS